MSQETQEKSQFLINQERIMALRAQQDKDIALNFLSRWQTLYELRRAKTQTVRSFFYAHNSRSRSLIEKRLRQIGAAHEVTDDPALIELMVLMTKCLVGQLRQFNQTINEFDPKIEEIFKSHPDHFLFESLPGAGEKLAPRLLSLFGSDRSRWPDASDICNVARYFRKFSQINSDGFLALFPGRDAARLVS